MSADTFKFKDDRWWDDSYSAMRFFLEKDGITYSCAISQIVLNDHFKTEDSREAAIKNFNDQSDVVRLLAVRLIESELHDKHGVFFITSNILHGYM